MNIVRIVLQFVKVICLTLLVRIDFRMYVCMYGIHAHPYRKFI